MTETTEQPRTLPRKMIFALLLVGLVTPLALNFVDDKIMILAVLWLYYFTDSHIYFDWVTQSFSTVVMWIWRFVILVVFIQFYEHKMSYRQFKYGAVIAQVPWIFANLGIFLNYLIGGNITYFMIPLPFLVLACFIVLRLWPRSELPETWLDEDKDASWGPTIRIDTDE